MEVSRTKSNPPIKALINPLARLANKLNTEQPTKQVKRRNNTVYQPANQPTNQVKKAP